MSIFSKLKQSKGNGPQPPLDLHTAFAMAGEANHTKVKSLGKLHLPTGAIIACDGLVYPGATPFSDKVSPGDYDVSVLISDQGRSGERYALAKLTFSENPAISWQLAIKKSQKLSKLNSGEIFGYPIDAGVGCFMDAKTLAEYDSLAMRLYEKDSTANLYDDYLEPLFKQNAEHPEDPEDSGNWANVTVPETDGDNVIIFASGWGGGVYASYWGYDANNNTCCLVTDFQVL